MSPKALVSFVSILSTAHKSRVAPKFRMIANALIVTIAILLAQRFRVMAEHPLPFRPVLYGR